MTMVAKDGGDNGFISRLRCWSAGKLSLQTSTFQKALQVNDERLTKISLGRAIRSFIRKGWGSSRRTVSKEGERGKGRFRMLKLTVKLSSPPLHSSMKLIAHHLDLIDRSEHCNLKSCVFY